MKREELLRSQEYWLTKIQNGIFNLIEQYRKEKNLNKTQLAAELGVTKGYISQVLNGDFDHKVSKLVDLSLAFNKVPVISYIDMEEYLQNDAADKSNYTLQNSERPIEVNTYICEVDEFSATYGYKQGFSIPVKN